MPTAWMAGSAYLYGWLPAAKLGVDKVLGLLTDDVRRTMALLGVAPDRRPVDRLPRSGALTSRQL